MAAVFGGKQQVVRFLSERSDCGKCDECGAREHGSKEGNGQGDCAADAEDGKDDGKNADEGLV